MALLHEEPEAWSDLDVIEGLRRGDEATFRHLVRLHHAGLRRMATFYVPEHAVEDVLQETWIAVVKGIDRFEGRSSLKTWIYRILINQSRRRGPKERRSIPFSAASGPREPTDPRDRLGHPELGPDYWPEPPADWHTDPEGRAVATEVRAVVEGAIRGLPDSQRAVITLRDVEGWPSEEVCHALRISAVNQRVLLHRARTAVRAALEVYFHDE